MRIRKKKKFSQTRQRKAAIAKLLYGLFYWDDSLLYQALLKYVVFYTEKKIITYQQSESVAVLLKYVFYHCKLFSNYFNFLSIYQNSIISIQTFQCGWKDFKKWNNQLKIKSERRRFKNEKEFEKLKVFYFYLNKNLNALRCQLSKKIVQR